MRQSRTLRIQVLPDSLLDSLRQAAASTNDAIAQQLPRCSAEILLPEFWDPMSGPVFSEEGDQMRFWKLCRRFADDLITLTGAKNACVVRTSLRLPPHRRPSSPVFAHRLLWAWPRTQRHDSTAVRRLRQCTMACSTICKAYGCSHRTTSPPPLRRCFRTLASRRTSSARGATPPSASPASMTGGLWRATRTLSSSPPPTRRVPPTVSSSPSWCRRRPRWCCSMRGWFRVRWRLRARRCDVTRLCVRLLLRRHERDGGLLLRVATATVRAAWQCLRDRAACAQVTSASA